ncbi:cupin domain-containing protein [Ottowia sp.]|jgi:quercetin dioxygenase-like cupin family protein|uniref:cupin domain-containing protein n=1 Tax=Ottowia sp. TaxID=1898956 RepID=UPI0025F2CD7C|nr:cupin domain-containing protein [Ottowia sp.]MBK6613367.1 cupin domain-containing protein [Ottowia sp.]MBK6747526.1 cupin domain-containing protein [Ottowia sp.]
MAQPHLASGQLGSVLPLGAQLASTPSHALLKAAQLEVMRVVLRAGKAMPEHRVAGEITVQCLEGVVDFRAGADVHRLRAGDFLHLAGGVPHELTAREDASLLVTICLLPA